MSVENPIIDNIILDDSVQIIKSELPSDYVLFSSLRADAEPLVPYTLNTFGIDYPQFFSPKCAICNSPHRQLLEYVYIDCGKKVNTVIKFFERHFNARLNWVQVRQHTKHHCDFNKIETPGLLDYEGKEEELNRWKYREYELAEIAILTEINDVRGIPAKNPDEILKRASMIEKLTRQLMTIKKERDDNSLGLPNVFEVLHDLHNLMINDEDKRIIREKVRNLKQTIN